MKRNQFGSQETRKREVTGEAASWLPGFGILILCCCFFGCSTPPSPEQIHAYSQAVHTGVQDYKAVVEITRRP